MPANQLSAKMRLAAPEQCKEMDELRALRKPLCDRLSYLGASDTEEATSLKQRITEFDTKVAALYSVA